MKSYNKYLTDNIQKGLIETKEVDGVTVYKVRRPKKDEEVIGHINFSERFAK